ncbi:hypothetical protein Q3G72_001978 [Acer saccharum]|nr:hypothetical protein Q3G72_001978 [Acer saccharum]
MQMQFLKVGYERIFLTISSKIMIISKAEQILLPFFGIFALTVLVCAQDQSGFISLDCGLPRDDTYTEATTKINYISDANYIETGSGKSILPEYKVGKQQQMWWIRSFPEGIRNCYRLNLTSGEKYLIRAYFMYGNYDDANIVPSFDVYIGPNFWKTLNFKNASTVKIPEIIHVLQSDYLHFCLVNTGKGTPFISALELRLLKNTTYITQSGSLELDTRVDIGSTLTPDQIYRDLSNNSLSGPVPEFLSQLSSLKVLNLERNKLTGLIPAALLDRQNNDSLSLSYDGNPDSDKDILNWETRLRMAVEAAQGLEYLHHGSTETARRKENANEFETGDSVEMMTVNLHDDVSPLAR